MSRRFNNVLVMTVFVVAFSCLVPTVSGADFNATQSAQVQITFDIPDESSAEEPEMVDDTEPVDTVVDTPLEGESSTDDAPLIMPEPGLTYPPVSDPSVDVPQEDPLVDIPISPAPAPDVVTPPEEPPVVIDEAPLVVEATDLQDISVSTNLEGLPNEEVPQ